MKKNIIRQIRKPIPHPFTGGMKKRFKTVVSTKNTENRFYIMDAIK